MKHTPGPWKMSKKYFIDGEFTAKNPWPVRSISPNHSNDDLLIARVTAAESGIDLELKANAHLIAAAPDLLKACEDARIEIEHLEQRGILVSVGTLEQIKKAIAKARNETP